MLGEASSRHHCISTWSLEPEKMGSKNFILLDARIVPRKLHKLESRENNIVLGGKEESRDDKLESSVFLRSLKHWSDFLCYFTEVNDTARPQDTDVAICIRQPAFPVTDVALQTKLEPEEILNEDKSSGEDAADFLDVVKLSETKSEPKVILSVKESTEEDATDLHDLVRLSKNTEDGFIPPDNTKASVDIREKIPKQQLQTKLEPEEILNEDKSSGEDAADFLDVVKLSENTEDGFNPLANTTASAHIKEIIPEQQPLWTIFHIVKCIVFLLSLLQRASLRATVPSLKVLVAVSLALKLEGIGAFETPQHCERGPCIPGEYFHLDFINCLTCNEGVNWNDMNNHNCTSCKRCTKVDPRKHQTILAPCTTKSDAKIGCLKDYEDRNLKDGRSNQPDCRPKKQNIPTVSDNKVSASLRNFTTESSLSPAANCCQHNETTIGNTGPTLNETTTEPGLNETTTEPGLNETATGPSLNGTTTRPESGLSSLCLWLRIAIVSAILIAIVSAILIAILTGIFCFFYYKKCKAPEHIDRDSPQISPLLPSGDTIIKSLNNLARQMRCIKNHPGRESSRQETDSIAIKQVTSEDGQTAV